MRNDKRVTEEGVPSQHVPGNIIRALSSKEVQVRLELEESPATSTSLLRTSPRMWRLSSEENLIENDIRLLRSASNVLNIVREILEQNVPMNDNGGSYVILERLQHLVVRLPEICERIKTCNAALKVQSKSGSEQVNALEEENSQLKLKVKELEGEVEVTKGVVAYFREQYEQELGNRIEVEQDLKHLMARVDAGSQIIFQPRSPQAAFQGQAHVVPIVANSPENRCDNMQDDVSEAPVTEDIEEADNTNANNQIEAAASPTISKTNYNLRNKSCESPIIERPTSPVSPAAITPPPPKKKMGWGGVRPGSGAKKRIIRISRVTPAKSLNADGQNAASSLDANGDATTKENNDDKVEGFRRTRSSSPLKEQPEQNPTNQSKNPRTSSPSLTKTTRRKRRQSSPLRGASSSKISSPSSLRSSRQRRHSPRLGESNKVKKLQTRAKLTLRKRRIRGTEQLQSISRVVTLRVRSRTAAESTLNSEGQFKGNIPTKLAPPPLKPEKEFKCKVCGDKFGVEYNLLRHIKYVHEGNRKYECEYCHRRFYQGQHLQQHLRNHTGERPFPCSKCPAVLQTKHGLKTHMKTHNPNRKRTFQCDICPRKTFTYADLINHVLIHNEDRPYKCPICDKGFKTPPEVTKHKKVHSDFKGHKCEVCKKEFRRRNELVLHTRQHTGERPYTCKTCGKTFSRSSHLSLHAKTHTGEKNYVCNVCNKRFSQKPACRRHMRNLHPEVMKGES